MAWGAEKFQIREIVVLHIAIHMVNVEVLFSLSSCSRASFAAFVRSFPDQRNGSQECRAVRRLDLRSALWASQEATEHSPHQIFPSYVY